MNKAIVVADGSSVAEENTIKVEKFGSSQFGFGNAIESTI